MKDKNIKSMTLAQLDFACSPILLRGYKQEPCEGLILENTKPFLGFKNRKKGKRNE